jgi:ribosomal protein S27AE
VENNKMFEKKLKSCSKCGEQDMILIHENICNECKIKTKEKNKKLLKI